LIRHEIYPFHEKFETVKKDPHRGCQSAKGWKPRDIQLVF